MSTKTRLCFRCKAEIPAERVEAIPETRLCVACSQAVNGEFDIRVETENLAKTNSLKKNYGGVSIKATRKRITPLEK